jgi:hypothetical protein
MFSLILPAYNEAPRLEKCVRECQRRFKQIGEDYEIIIAEDGSTDGTDMIAAKIARRDKRVKHLHQDNKLGRGRAVTLASKIARGDRIGFIDVDMATRVDFLDDLVKYSKKYDVVTGSRYVPGAELERPLLREFASKAYNLMIRVLLGVELYDSQCGFKAFSKRFVKKEMGKIKENSWAWDAAVLIHAIKSGYSFKEFPVVWKEKKEAAHSASMSRLMRDAKLHGTVVLKMFLKWRLGLPVQV